MALRPPVRAPPERAGPWSCGASTSASPPTASPSLPRDNLWLTALVLLAEVCAHLGDERGARELRALLEPYSGRNVVTPGVAYLGPVDRYLGLLATVTGDHDQAAAWFASARDLAGAMGARPTMARLALDEAEALRERDPARSAVLAAEAASEADELGLSGWPSGPGRWGRRNRRSGAAPAQTARAGARPAPRGRRLGGHRRRRPFHLKDAKGLHHLARLLARPGHEFHALELVGGTAPGASSAREVDAGLEVRSSGQDDAGPALDAQAKAEYRERITELREEIEEAESFHDPERASRAREELDLLSQELSAAVGLGGRDRPTGAASERARVNVTRALRTVIDRVAEHDEGLGHHLRTCVRTGTFCAYEPGPGATRWNLGSGS